MLYVPGPGVLALASWSNSDFNFPNILPATFDNGKATVYLFGLGI